MKNLFGWAETTPTTTTNTTPTTTSIGYLNQPLEGDWERTCQNCGNVYLPDAKFCRKCGHKRAKIEVAVEGAEYAGGYTSGTGFTTSAGTPAVEFASAYTRPGGYTSGTEYLSPGKAYKNALSKQIEQSLTVDETVVEVPFNSQKEITVEVPQKHFFKTHKYVPVVKEETEVLSVEVPEIFVKEQLDVQRQEEFDITEKVVPHTVTHEKLKVVTGETKLTEKTEFRDLTLSLPKIEKIIEHPVVSVTTTPHYVTGTSTNSKEEVTHEMPYVVKVPQVELVLKEGMGESVTKTEYVKEVVQDTRVLVEEREQYMEKTVVVTPEQQIHNIKYNIGFTCDGIAAGASLETGRELQDYKVRLSALEAEKRSLQLKLNSHVAKCSELMAVLQKKTMTKAELEIELKALREHQSHCAVTSSPLKKVNTSGWSPYTKKVVVVSSGTCPNCGNVYMPDAIYCRKCGQKRQM